MSIDLNRLGTALAQYRRISVVGCHGSGKTTLSHLLGRSLGIPVTHLDDLHWEANWRRGDDASLLRDLEVILRRDSWIVDGSYFRLGLDRLLQSDLIIVLNTPAIVCGRRVLLRSIRRALGDESTLPRDIRAAAKSRRADHTLSMLARVARFNRTQMAPFLSALADASNSPPLIVVGCATDLLAVRGWSATR